jgi:16S rRNA (guanine527-N7)-methyltransferase
MEAKQVFREFLQQHIPDRAALLLERFEAYHPVLSAPNRELNLISRQMPEDDYWTVHYLDSLLPVEHIDCANCRVLDFGSGGGLPAAFLDLLPEAK